MPGDAVGGMGGELLGDVLAGDLAKNESFEQGVAGESVGAVQAGGGGFTAAIEVGDVGAGLEVGFDAADHVVGAGSDGNEVGIDVDVEGLAQG